MRIKSSLVAASLGLGLLAFPAEAQNCSVPGTGGTCSLNHVVDATVPTVASLSFPAGSSIIPVTAADFAAGQSDTPGPLIQIGSNSPWTLNVKSAAATWTGTSGGDADKPASDLMIQHGAGSFKALSTTDQELASGTAQPVVGALTTLRTLWFYQLDPPGNYRLTVVFTLSAP